MADVVLGRRDALRELGPHHTTTPKEVVEFVITQLRQGDVDEAFSFTCIPVAKRGCHKSSTDWSRRMAWEKASVIAGAPSGKAYERAMELAADGKLEQASNHIAITWQSHSNRMAIACQSHGNRIAIACQSHANRTPIA